MYNFVRSPAVFRGAVRLESHFGGGGLDDRKDVCLEEHYCRGGDEEGRGERGAADEVSDRGGGDDRRDAASCGADSHCETAAVFEPAVDENAHGDHRTHSVAHARECGGGAEADESFGEAEHDEGEERGAGGDRHAAAESRPFVERPHDEH